jgi:hypothetical protein
MTRYKRPARGSESIDFSPFFVRFQTRETARKKPFFTTLADILPQERKLFIFPKIFRPNGAYSLDLICG